MLRRPNVRYKSECGSRAVLGRRDVYALRLSRARKILLCVTFLHAPAGGTSEWGPIHVGM